MIDESFYWKRDLLKWAEALRQRKQVRRWRQASYSRLEQIVMLGFYAVRKLREAAKLTDAVGGHTLQVTAYPWNGHRLTIMNWPNIDSHYDLGAPTVQARSLGFICDQLIHSYVFLPLFESETGPLCGVYFSSERQRLKWLFSLQLDRIIQLFEQIGNDDVTRMQMQFNEERQDFDVQAW